MIEIRNIIINKLYNYINKPVIPNTNTKNRPEYPFADYSITTLIKDDGEGNYSIEEGQNNARQSLSLQNKISFSFNVYSRDEVESYNLAKDIWDWFKFIGVEDLALDNIAVVDVFDIENRTILEINEYEQRYGFDVIVRYSDNIERVDPYIETYSMEGRIIKE